MAKRKQKSYIEKLQEDINSLSNNQIGCSGIINIQEIYLPIVQGSDWNPKGIFVPTVKPQKDDICIIPQNPETEKPSKKMESYPKRTQRKIRLD